jgi:hypothetical protein
MGIPGDYEALYTWLDLHDAKVCGRSLAFLNYSYEGDLKRELTDELRRALEFTRKACIYIVYTDPEDKQLKGTFIIGRRRSTPWHGYAELAVQDDV